STHDSGGPTTF
nr:immunoglobulin light chain junction region [Macaca mulatta]